MALEKLTSGRWIQTVSFTLTYCLIMTGMCYMVIKGKIEAAVFLGAFSGFTTMVVLINEWYFKREDRGQKGQGQ